MGVARAWSRSEMGKFLPSLSVNFIIYLQNVWSAMSLSLLVPEEKKLPISINFQKSVYPLYCIYMYISGTKPQGLFNSASFSHRRPHFNSDRQILRYSVLLGIHYKFNDDWWITFVPAMRLQKWRISLNREFLLICV